MFFAWFFKQRGRSFVLAWKRQKNPHVLMAIYENNRGFEIGKTKKQFQLLFRAGFEPGSHVTHRHIHIYLSCLTSVLATSTESHSIAISKHVILSLLSAVTSAPLSNKKLSRLRQFCMQAKWSGVFWSASVISNVLNSIGSSRHWTVSSEPDCTAKWRGVRWRLFWAAISAPLDIRSRQASLKRKNKRKETKLRLNTSQR